MEILFTALCTVGALFALYGAYEARAYTRIVQKEAARLAALRGRVQSLEDGAESLLKQHRKLRGAFYAAQAEAEDELDAHEHNAELIDAGMAPGPVCENYLRSQTEGPRSEAAQCMCAYCLGRRAERDRLRQRLPKGTHADRVRAIEAAS